MIASLHPSILAALFLLFASVAGDWSVAAGASLRTPPLGSVLEGRTLKDMQGRAQPLLTTDRVQVLVFFRTGQAESVSALKQVEKVRGNLGGRPVRFVGVTSSRQHKPEVEAALLAAASTLTTLLDADDEVRASWSVILDPVVVLVDGKHRLLRLQPYFHINFGVELQLRIRHAVGELDDAALAAALAPPRAGFNEAGQARRHLHMAEMLAKATKPEQAVAAARRALELDPRLLEAYVLIGDLRRGQGDCTAAIVAYDKALALQRDHPPALSGIQACTPAKKETP